MSCPYGIEGHTSSGVPSPSSNNGSHLSIYYFIYAVVIFYGATAIFRCFTRTNRFTRSANIILSLPIWIIILTIFLPFSFVFMLYAILTLSDPFEPAMFSTTNNVTGGDDKTKEITLTNVVGLDQSIIAILPTSTYKGNDGEKCQVCGKEVENGEVMKFLPSCMHTFHVDCITKWLKSNVVCPICQVKVSFPPAVAEEEEEEEEEEEISLEASTRSNNNGLGSSNLEESLWWSVISAIID